MEYTALYRKFRPQNFDEVVGQDHIVKTLINQIESGRITHAYLFCGTRGTGKTSVAKIFAKAVNCLNPIDAGPCNKCSLCMAMNEGRSLNIIEIDAASNNSVDNIREIRDEVIYPPAEGRYKVYIIDEVHMLSIGAFNALLKTLEEPPSHVIFILATTDPQKIPVTILSRCQRFDFKRISNSAMAQAIKSYMLKENVLIDDDAVNYIVRISDGAMRDALSILEQCISYYYGERITFDKVLEISGSVDDSVFFKLTDFLFDLNSSGCMDIIDEIIQNGRDINQFVSELIMHWRNELIAITVDGDSNVLDIGGESVIRYLDQGQRIGSTVLMKLINKFSSLQPQLKYAFNNRILLEITCIKFCNAVESEDLTDLLQKIKSLEKKIDEAAHQSVYVIKKDKADIADIKADSPEPKPKRKIAASEDIQKVIDGWDKVRAKFSLISAGILNFVKPEGLEDKYLYIVCDNDFYYNKVKKIKEELDKKIEETFDKKYDLIIIERKEYEKKKNSVLLNDEIKGEENIEQSIKAIDFDIQID